jgi:hypothetical protein
MSEEEWIRLALKGARSCAAWLGAVLVGAFAGTAILSAGSFLNGGTSWGSQFAGLFLLLAVTGGASSAPLAALAVFAIRATGSPRPWADALCGAIAMLSAALLLGVIFGFGALVFLEEVALAAISAGAAAGLVYWLIAGMPKADPARAWWRNVQIDL